MAPSLVRGERAYYRQGTIVHLRDLPRRLRQVEGESAVVITFDPEACVNGSPAPGWVVQLEAQQWGGKKLLVAEKHLFLNYYCAPPEVGVGCLVETKHPALEVRNTMLCGRVPCWMLAC